MIDKNKPTVEELAACLGGAIIGAIAVTLAFLILVLFTAPRSLLLVSLSLSLFQIAGGLAGATAFMFMLKSREK